MSQSLDSTPISKVNIVPLFKAAISKWAEDKVPKLAGSLAYFTVLSLAPLLVVTIKVIGMIFGAEAAKGQVQHQISSLAGPEVAKAVQDAIVAAGKPGAGIPATIISILIAIWGASGVFGELQDSLNTIWDVKPKPGLGIMGWIRARFVSMAMVLGIAFLLLVSMFVSTMLGAVSSGLMSRLTGGDGMIAKIVAYFLDFVISTAVITVLFSAIFKLLPDVKIRWREVWPGGLLTAVLFQLGKYGLSWYLSTFAPGSAFGAAGSLVALLLWCYYSAFILYYGAEFTRVYAQRRGSGIKPQEHAMRMTEVERTLRGMPHKETVAAAARGQTVDGPRPPRGVPVDRGHVIQLPPSVPQLQRRKWQYGGAGLLLGAAATAALGTWLAEQQSQSLAGSRKPRRRDIAASQLDERLDRIQAKVGDVKRFERKVRAQRVYDQVQAIGDHLIQYQRRARKPEPVYRELGREFVEGFRRGYRKKET
jgi:membrane protein